MRNRVWLLPLIFLGLAGIGQNTASAQTSPTSQEESTHGKVPTEFSIGGDLIENDADAQRFQEAFAERLQASSKLYWWGSASYLLPEDGVRIRLVSTQVNGEHGEIIGSAIVASASLRSPKDANAERLIDTKHWFVRHGAPVDDIVQTYFDQLEDRLLLEN